MEIINRNNEDTLGKLVKEEGLLLAPADFTSGIMNQVSHIASVTENSYKPLIGIKGWIIIVISLIMLLACCIMVLASGDYTSAGYLNFMEPVFGFLQNLEISWNINFGSVFIGTMVFVSIVILLSVDFIFNTSIRIE
ncbi:MAG: hypothetical protein JXB19_07025 [Bacteroidales bacterium]|nr:hypothetical protein [Bacteroidales bacterium]